MLKHIIFTHTIVLRADFYGFSGDERDARGIQQYRDSLRIEIL